MSEQKLQTKILKWLKYKDCYVFKTIICNRNGVPDIIGCTPSGKFFAVEVKYGKNKASKLQDWNLAEIRKRDGIGILAYSLEDVERSLGEHLG